MLPNYLSSKDLLVNATKSKLYNKLIIQLNKDFRLANIDFRFSENSSPLVLKEELTKAVKHLILNDFKSYNSLLYIVDIPEELIGKTDATNFDDYTDHVVFLLLKRVWKKVWFRDKYST